MTITVEKALQNNQSILENFAFGEELDAQAAEIISGGAEGFIIRNATGSRLTYTVDGVTPLDRLSPGEKDHWITDQGGIISFDYDGSSAINFKKYDLSDGKIYEFRQVGSDFELYDVG